MHFNLGWLSLCIRSKQVRRKQHIVKPTGPQLLKCKRLKFELREGLTCALGARIAKVCII